MRIIGGYSAIAGPFLLAFMPEAPSGNQTITQGIFTIILENIHCNSVRGKETSGGQLKETWLLDGKVQAKC